MEKITAKQEAFCIEYIKDFNATQAAIRAGYSKKTANRIGSENLSKLVIKERLDKMIEEITGDKNKMIIENIKFWTGVRNGAEGEADMKDRLKASEYIGKYAAMFTENHTLTGRDGEPLAVRIIDDIS